MVGENNKQTIVEMKSYQPIVDKVHHTIKCFPLASLYSFEIIFFFKKD